MCGGALEMKWKDVCGNNKYLDHRNLLRHSFTANHAACYDQIAFIVGPPCGPKSQSTI